MTDKPYAEIRKALVEGIRNDPKKPADVKHAAEVLIVVIDNMEKFPGDELTQDSFRRAYAVFTRVAEGQTFPEVLSPAEIAKAFGLHRRDLQ
jgi:hypothetical protein